MITTPHKSSEPLKNMRGFRGGHVDAALKKAFYKGMCLESVAPSIVNMEDAYIALANNFERSIGMVRHLQVLQIRLLVDQKKNEHSWWMSASTFFLKRDGVLSPMRDQSGPGIAQDW
jgi:hypothetical protein